MAKAIKAFWGNDTYGRQVERAKSVSGKWYARHYEFNGYGSDFCKWYESEPSYSSETKNAYTGDIIKHDPVVMWGWNKMSEYDKVPRFRLPA